MNERKKERTFLNFCTVDFDYSHAYCCTQTVSAFERNGTNHLFPEVRILIQPDLSTLER